MADISMCPGDTCQSKEKCYRFKAEPSNCQSYSVFTKNIKGDRCDDFIQYETLLNDINKG